MAFTKLEPKSVNTNATFTFANANITGNLNVNGKTDLGSVANISIDGGSSGQILSTDGSGQLSWVDYSGGSGSGTTIINGFAGITKDLFTADGETSTFTLSETPESIEFISINIDGVIQQSSAYTLTGSDVVFSENPFAGEKIEISIFSVNSSAPAGTAAAGFSTQVQFNTGGELDASSHLTYNKSTSTLSASHFSGEGSAISNVNATKLDGYDSSYFATSTQGSLADTAVQPSDLTGYATETYVTTAIENASLTGPDLTGYATETYVDTAVSNLINSAPSALNTLNELANALGNDASYSTTITTALSNKLNSADFNSTANTWYNTKTVASLVISEVGDLVEGGSLQIASDYSNVTYPGGVFTITQLPPVVIQFVNTWENDSTVKNAYTDYELGSVNTSNVLIELSITGSTFDIQSSDDLTIGSTTITGTELISLGLTSSGGTITIPSASLSSGVQTNASTIVTANLTTLRGIRELTGSTLTTTQPVSFNIGSIAGSFTGASVPFWDPYQSFNWQISDIIGSITGGNVVFSGIGGGDSGTLTTSGATSGSSASIDSSYSYLISTDDYRGVGLNGAGTRTIPETVDSVIIAASASFYPLFWKTTNNSDNPEFTINDDHYEEAYAIGQGANTSGDPADYLWIAIPGSSNHTFEFIYFGYQMIMTPDVIFESQLISNHAYNVYGFTNASAILNITVKT